MICNSHTPPPLSHRGPRQVHFTEALDSSRLTEGDGSVLCVFNGVVECTSFFFGLKGEPHLDGAKRDAPPLMRTLTSTVSSVTRFRVCVRVCVCVCECCVRVRGSVCELPSSVAVVDRSQDLSEASEHHSSGVFMFRKQQQPLL
ncbi:unnamed protein product [Arctogadus glacialis]